LTLNIHGLFKHTVDLGRTTLETFVLPVGGNSTRCFKPGNSGEALKNEIECTRDQHKVSMTTMFTIYYV